MNTSNHIHHFTEKVTGRDLVGGPLRIFWHCDSCTAYTVQDIITRPRATKRVPINLSCGHHRLVSKGQVVHGRVHCPICKTTVRTTR